MNLNSRIKKSTIFTGFCQHHDNILFESFEKNGFSAEYKQIYDLTLRAYAGNISEKMFIKIFNGYHPR